jgi:Domain of unknown function (DUF6378)
MSTKVVVYGPGLQAPGRVSKQANAALEDLQLRGYSPASHPRETQETNEEYMRRLVRTLTNVQGLVLLPRWEDSKEAVTIGQTAILLGLPVHLYTAPGNEMKELSLNDITAPIMPGFGVVAPDSNANELPHEEAARIVLGPRGAYYDSPLHNFERTALMWSGVLYSKLKDGERVSAEDVSLCMLAVKMARESFRHKRDNLVDAHGYLLTYQMVLDERAKLEDGSK